jgi:protein-S-isoprenylcysteine O-methyltransferase Ste14
MPPAPSGQRLPQSGPYRWIRHLLNSTGIALFLALALIATNWFMLRCAVVAFIGVRAAVIRREERGR